jgi:hypothetical protein
MTFRVGQKVVCVDARATDASGDRELFKGAIYTIRWAGRYDGPFPWVWGQFYGVRLEGLHRLDPWTPENSDLPFDAVRFRPVVERETDIRFAHEILRTASQKERA